MGDFGERVFSVPVSDENEKVLKVGVGGEGELFVAVDVGNYGNFHSPQGQIWGMVMGATECVRNRIFSVLPGVGCSAGGVDYFLDDLGASLREKSYVVDLRGKFGVNDDNDNYDGGDVWSKIYNYTQGEEEKLRRPLAVLGLDSDVNKFEGFLQTDRGNTIVSRLRRVGKKGGFWEAGNDVFEKLVLPYGVGESEIVELESRLEALAPEVVESLGTSDRVRHVHNKSVGFKPMKLTHEELCWDGSCSKPCQEVQRDVVTEFVKAGLRGLVRGQRLVLCRGPAGTGKTVVMHRLLQKLMKLVEEKKTHHRFFPVHGWQALAMLCMRLATAELPRDGVAPVVIAADDMLYSSTDDSGIGSLYSESSLSRGGGGVLFNPDFAFNFCGDIISPFGSWVMSKLQSEADRSNGIFFSPKGWVEKRGKNFLGRMLENKGDLCQFDGFGEFEPGKYNNPRDYSASSVIGRSSEKFTGERMLLWLIEFVNTRFPLTVLGTSNLSVQSQGEPERGIPAPKVLEMPGVDWIS